MRKSAKIAIGIGVTAVVVLMISGFFAVHYVASNAAGGVLANEGDLACLNRDYDLAVAKLTAALQTTITGKQRANTYLNRGIAYNAKLKFDEAIRDFNAVLALDPEIADAYTNRGLARQQKGATDPALADFSKAIELDPNAFYAFYNRGLIYLAKREWDKASADLREAARCDPENADALVNLSLAYLGKNDLDHALASLDGAIAVEPTNVRAYTERSKIYATKNDWNASFRDSAEAEKLSPPSTRPAAAAAAAPRSTPARTADTNPDKNNPYFDLFHQALIANSNRDFDRAIELNNRLLMMDISRFAASNVLLNRGNAYRAKNDWDHALQDSEEAIKLSPTNAGAYVDRASILSHNGDYDGALKDLDEAVRLNPKQWEAYFNRAADFVQLGESDRALVDLEQVMKLNPKFAGAHLNRGSVYFKKGEIDRAISDYRKAIELDPHLLQAYQGEVLALLRKNRSAEAAGVLEHVARLEHAQMRDVLNSVAWTLATSSDDSMRDGKNAIITAKKACSLDDWKDWRCIDTLAAAYAEAGKFDQAVKYQEQVVQHIAPEDTNAGGAKERLALYQQHKPYRRAPQS
jgi:tetratricopeptide (TPR) repeat protein